MKVLLTAFGLHNPYARSELQEHAIIPIAFDAPTGGLDLDYSALLVAESFILDEQAFEYIRQNRRTFLTAMWTSVTALIDAGLVELADYGDVCAPHAKQIVDKTEHLLRSVEAWRPIAREQWLTVRPEFEEFASRYGSAPRQMANAAHYGVLNHLQNLEADVTVTEVTRVERLLLTRRTRLSRGEQDVLRDVFRPLVAQAVIYDLLRTRLGAPFLDWDDAEAFHEQLRAARWTAEEAVAEDATGVAREARRLFSVVIPEFRPGRIEDVIKFLKSKGAVASLRAELAETLERGERVSADWMVRTQVEAARAQLVASERGRVIKWFGRCISAWIPGASLLTEAAIEASEDIAETVMRPREAQRFEWLYALQRLAPRTSARGVRPDQCASCDAELSSDSDACAACGWTWNAGGEV